MKNNRIAKYCGLAAAALLLACATSPSRAGMQTTTYINTFDVGANTADFSGSGSVASWIYWYGSGYNNTPMTNHVSADAGNSATSGSLVMQACPASGDQIVAFGTFDNGWAYDFITAANFYLFTNVDFYIKVSPTSTLNGSGNYGVLSVGAMISYGYTEFAKITVPASAATSWYPVQVHIPKTFGNLANTPDGLAFAVAAWNTPTANPDTVYWIDDLELEITPGPPPPPPTLSTITPAISGFNQTATDNNNQYDRYNILTAPATGFSFVGQPSVTYSWTNKVWPAISTATAWQQQLFLVSGTPGQYDSAVDWNMANVLWFTVQEQTDGTAYVQMRAKTNYPGGNSMLFNTYLPTDTVNNPNGWPVEPLATNVASTPLGHWSVTIAGTLVTIETPDHTTTTYTLPAAWLPLFAEPMTVCLGSQPNQPSGYGQTAVISGFGVSGNVAPFKDDFTADAAFNPTYWRVLAGDASGVNLVPATSACWVSWSLPDAGFSFQSSPSLLSSMTDQPGVLEILDNGKRTALVPSSLVGANQGFFRLVEHTFSQLQVLLPGESNAPNTPTGKAGTPDEVYLSLGGNEDVTVNAVDDKYNIVSGVTDMIRLTCSTDPLSFMPNDTAMVNGTVTFTGVNAVAFGTTGLQTIMATDTAIGSTIPTANSTQVLVGN
jgi:hypothetical protein